MRKRKYVIARKYLPADMRLSGFIVLWLLLDRLNASEVVFTIYYTLIGVILLMYLYTKSKVKEIEVDIENFLKDRGDAQQKKEELKEFVDNLKACK